MSNEQEIDAYMKRIHAERAAKKRAVEAEKLLKEFRRAYVHWMKHDTAGTKFMTLYDKVCDFLDGEEQTP